jgi:hypothetical protein
MSDRNPSQIRGHGIGLAQRQILERARQPIAQPALQLWTPTLTAASFPQRARTS